ncbi:MAG: hypothetical protein HC849_21915 [Oscillatoriales cyanobacterium RU_3_3]|nr:hypothetical protein [Oscillatoriales cyanobacterium RU_3_3]NJR26347.1 hypothetical protein [Richelia sp. CSU_2_1]
MSDCGCQFEAKNKAQRKILRILFAANAAMFAIGIIAGFLVNLLNSRFPDLIIGFIIAIAVMRGGISIIRDARSEQIQHQRL